MQLPPRKGVVRRFQVRRNLVRDDLEFFKQAVQRGNDRRAQALLDFIFKARLVGGWRGANFQFHLIQPPAQVGEKSLLVGDRHLVILADEMKLLPVAQQVLEAAEDFFRAARIASRRWRNRNFRALPQ